MFSILLLDLLSLDSLRYPFRPFTFLFGSQHSYSAVVNISHKIFVLYDNFSFFQRAIASPKESIIVCSLISFTIVPSSISHHDAINWGSSLDNCSTCTSIPPSFVVSSSLGSFFSLFFSSFLFCGQIYCLFCSFRIATVPPCSLKHHSHH